MRFPEWLRCLFCIFLLNFPEVVRNAEQKEKFTNLRILNLNTWGTPWPLSRDKGIRMRAIRDEIKYGNYDIVMLQELWYRDDYDLIRQSMPYVTAYKTLNSGCIGIVAPVGCSGLAILSRYPIIEEALFPYAKRGNFWRFDGEVVVKKGVGYARIAAPDLIIDVFTTHLVSYVMVPEENQNVRKAQVLEALSLVQNSTADVVVFGGDFNALPERQKNEPYAILTRALKDPITQNLKRSGSMKANYATYGNVGNSYTGHLSPLRIDYLLYRGSRNGRVRKGRFYDGGSADEPKTEVSLVKISMPLLKTRKDNRNLISISDHEAIVLELVARKRGKAARPIGADPTPSYTVGRPAYQSQSAYAPYLKTFRRSSRYSPEYYVEENSPAVGSRSDDGQDFAGTFEDDYESLLSLHLVNQTVEQNATGTEPPYYAPPIPSEALNLEFEQNRDQLLVRFRGGGQNHLDFSNFPDLYDNSELSTVSPDIYF